MPRLASFAWIRLDRRVDEKISSCLSRAAPRQTISRAIRAHYCADIIS
jgi:hypothetical protein